jgi:hypothetical protein
MAVFASDTFVEASDTVLASHTPVVGGSWVEHPNFTTDASVFGGGGYVFGASTSATSVYYNNGTPFSADYEVEATLRASSVSDSTATPGVFARMSTSASTWYVGQINSSTLLATGGTPANNTNYVVRLECYDAGKEFFVDGASVLTSANNDVTAAGKSGLRTRANGRVSAFTATDTNVGTSVNVTGVAGTSSVGSLTGTSSGTRTLSGVAGASAVGTLGITAGGNVTTGITGVGATTAVGTLTAPYDTNAPVTGVAATGAVGTFAATAGSLAATDKTASRIYPRDKDSTSKNIVFAGTYTGQVPVSIELKLVNATGGATIQDWTALTGATIGAGAWSGTLNVPQGGVWLHFFARSKDASGNIIHTTAESANSWGVGLIFSMIGQSNMSNWFDQSSGPPVTSTLTKKYKGGWGAVGGNGAIRFANLMQSATGLLIGLIDRAVSGSGLVMNTTSGAGYWLNLAGTPWTSYTTDLTAVGDSNFICWMQGEHETVEIAAAEMDRQDHIDGLDTLYTRLQAATGRTAAQLPFICGVIGTCDLATTATDDQAWNDVQTALLEWRATTTGVYPGGISTDLPRSDAVHITTAAYERLARRYAQTAQFILGLAASHGGGPEITRATWAEGADVVRIHVTHQAGTALLNGAGSTTAGSLHGIRVFDDGVEATISSYAFIEPNVIEATLSAVPVGPITVDYLFGAEPAGLTNNSPNTGFVFDNTTPGSDTLGLPLLLTNGAILAVPPSTATSILNPILRPILHAVMRDLSETTIA